MNLRSIKAQAITFLSEFIQSKIAAIGLVIAIAFVLMALLAQFIAPYSPFRFSADFLQPPSLNHLLGTNEMGQDVLSMVIYGSQVSLLVATVAGSFSIIIGTLIGLLAGYKGGHWLDEFLMRFTDMFLCLPWLPLLIVLALLLGASIWNVILIIGLASWPSTARLVRSQVLSTKERTYVEATKAINGSDSHIIFRHILPNVLPVVIANSCLRIATALLMESSLSFFGLGDPLHLSWGMVLHYVFAAALSNKWWYVGPPGICIMLSVFSFYLIGNRLDEMFNPKFKKI